MSYESPIYIYEKPISSQIASKKEEMVLEYIYNLGIDCNKEELIKALKYDRDQYDKGFKDGYHAKEMETKVHELSKEEWEEWKSNRNRDPICSVWKDDYTPMWHLKPEDIHEPAFLMGVLKLYNGKPKMEDIKWT